MKHVSLGNTVGKHIRETIIPVGVTVTAAAKRLGVGRVALSNLLNGKAKLSQDMALRLEKAFGANAEALLRMQSEQDQSDAAPRAAAMAVVPYSSNIALIRASEIEAWAAQQQEARSKLAALLRRLVVSTADGLSALDFPAYENSERTGWDGRSTTSGTTPWVPSGETAWEFGVNGNPAQKAERDFQARTRDPELTGREQTTFVFVTPRNWPGKNAWRDAKRGLGVWKDVRAYDASDLEQWIETSASAQAWMAEQCSRPIPGAVSLERAWSEWADVTDPPLASQLLGPLAAYGAPKLKKWLASSPSDPFTIIADSSEEALAVLACCANHDDLKQSSVGDRMLILRSADIVTKAAPFPPSAIIVLATEEAQQAAAIHYRGRHIIEVVLRKDRVESPNLKVDILDATTFHDALSAMGLDPSTVARLDQESGRSLAVLRRLRAKPAPLKSPHWAADEAIARQLVPLLLIGAWDRSVEADRNIIGAMTTSDIEASEKTIRSLAHVPDAPVWSVGNLRGFVSKTDAFFALRTHVTERELKRFFELARSVLAEADPALELPEEKRWAASIHGKSRRHSSVIRNAICETLVLLSVHGGNLFRSIGFGAEARVADLIRALLSPTDGSLWPSQRDDLPRYAEASPETFLEILETDLRSPTPQVYALLAATGSGGFASPQRSGLLWALEILAWNPRFLRRVVTILGKLAEVTIDDNWMNKPINSLASIFRCWMPQTKASVDERIAILEHLVRVSPTVGWQICKQQWSARDSIGHYNSRPRWRADAAGAGEPVKRTEAAKFALHALDIALAWPNHDASQLGDLIGCVDTLTEAQQKAVWSAVDAWIATAPKDADKAKLSEAIRFHSPRARRRRQDGAGMGYRARAALDSLAPADLVVRHAWLFAKHWVHLSTLDVGDVELTYQEEGEFVEKLRAAALREVWNADGLSGIDRLCRLGETAAIIGRILAQRVLDPSDVRAVVATFLSAPSISHPDPLDDCVSGLLNGLRAEDRTALLDEFFGIAPEIGPDAIARLLRLAPFTCETWARVDGLTPEERAAYWRTVPPRWLRQEELAQANSVVDELLAAGRPRSAFVVVHMWLENVATDRVVAMLQGIAENSAEAPDDAAIQGLDIAQAFEELERRSDIAEEVQARLEFAFLPVLEHGGPGMPGLQRRMAKRPELFVEAVALAFPRKDGQQDPPGLRPKSPEAAKNMAELAFLLLSHVTRVPGTNDDGAIDPKHLRSWIGGARDLAFSCGRSEIADLLIGQWLGRCPKGGDGIWPHEAVREAIEAFPFPDLTRGFVNGRLNARGATWRGEGGDQERSLAASYRADAGRLAADYPETARALEALAGHYERDALWWDIRDEGRRRLGR